MRHIPIVVTLQWPLGGGGATTHSWGGWTSTSTCWDDDESDAICWAGEGLDATCWARPRSDVTCGRGSEWACDEIWGGSLGVALDLLVTLNRFVFGIAGKKITTEVTNLK